MPRATATILSINMIKLMLFALLIASGAAHATHMTKATCYKTKQGCVYIYKGDLKAFLQCGYVKDPSARTRCATEQTHGRKYFLYHKHEGIEL